MNKKIMKEAFRISERYRVDPEHARKMLVSIQTRDAVRSTMSAIENFEQYHDALLMDKCQQEIDAFLAA